MLALVYEAKHHQKSSLTLMMLALPYSPLCYGNIVWVLLFSFIWLSGFSLMTLSHPKTFCTFKIEKQNSTFFCSMC